MINTAGTPSLPHTAITSWSGYIYQGKSALCHSISLLANDVNNSTLSLQLDALEDFAFLDGENVKSMHQVKALQSQSYGAYSVALDKLKEKANRVACTEALFHTAKKITNKTKTDIETTHNPVKMYIYGSDHWCAVNEIDEKIEDNIKKFYEKNFPGNLSKVTAEYLKKTRQCLDQLVLQQVLYIHKLVHDHDMSDREAAFTKTIDLSAFLNILNKDLHEINDAEYYFYVLLNDLHNYYQEYCFERDLAEEEERKLSNYMKKISTLNKENLEKFIKTIIPHRKFNCVSLQNYKDNTINKDEVKDAFLKILKELKEVEISNDMIISWSAAEKHYIPTAIVHGNDLAPEICESIIKNAQNTDLEIIYEGKSLITASMTVPSIFEQVPSVINSPEEDANEQNHIFRWKKVALVTLKEIKDIINA